MAELDDPSRNDLAEYIQLSLSNTVGIYGVPDDELESLAGELDDGIRSFVEAEIRCGIERRSGLLDAQ